MTTTADTFKKKTDMENEENRPPSNLQPAPKEKEPHQTHSFEWCWGDRRPPNKITCNEAGTVEDSLKKSSQFKTIAEKQKDKELVIVTDGRAISSHFPCSLIKDKHLTVKFVKAEGCRLKNPVSGSVHFRRKTPLSELVVFHVLVKGGKNVVKIMRNQALKTAVHEITVYAYKGEKVKQALKRDERLLNIIFRKNCVLSNKSTNVNTEMSNLVDDLDGETFQIRLLNKLSPPESQSSSLEDAYITQSESQNSDSSEGQGPSQQPPTAEPENDNMPNKKLKLEKSTPEKILRKMPGSKNMQHQLLSQFKDSVKGMKTPVSRLSRIQNMFRVEFSQSTEMCKEVKTMKKLMDLSASVCQVRINRRPEGSGFLLFDKFVLTNGHVIKNIYNENRRKLDQEVTVHFSYESVDEGEGGQVAVDEVVGFEYYPDVPGCDWALLRLRGDHELPLPLLTHFAFHPQSRGICIIGHPGGGVKIIGPCLIVPSEDRGQVVERHYRGNQGPIQFVTRHFFEGVAYGVQQNNLHLTYETCFYFGSSGSPVFDNHCNIVAMHTGGYPYPSKSGEIQSVIEYGHRLSDIIERIIIQMVERQRFEELKKYLACSCAHHENILDNVKKLVESRNLIVFKNTLNNLVTIDDQNLKRCFEFFLQKEEPVPMDISVHIGAE